MFRIVQKNKGALCQAHGCTNNKRKKDRFCRKHRHRYTKENNTVAYVYGILKSNAKRRGKVFTISLCYFRLWCSHTGYIEKRGKTGKSASIDRINPEKGYEVGNLQILSLSDNSRKLHSDKELPF